MRTHFKAWQFFSLRICHPGAVTHAWLRYIDSDTVCGHTAVDAAESARFLIVGVTTKARAMHTTTRQKNSFPMAVLCQTEIPV